MRRKRSVKILATLGPASATPTMIAKLFEAGADAFRLNFSHGSAEDHRERARIIRSIEHETGRPIAILADLQGPKLRIGIFVGGTIDLRIGQPFQIDNDPAPGDSTRVCLPHPEILSSLKPGIDLLLDDGRVRINIEEANGEKAIGRIVAGTKLSDRKGVNLPGVLVPLSPLTPKDRRDLQTALEIGVDWIALSFVQRPEDIVEARGLIGGQAGLMAKIEKPSAIDRLDEIVELSDAIMVARGDLGVEMPLAEVPGLQKRIVRASRKLGRPVVVATQMLESMISAPVPTRAEVSDVATAVYDGADAVMLSAESAAGDYPVEAVSTMNAIAEQVEHDPLYRSIMDAEHAVPEPTSADAISAAAGQVADTIGAVVVATYTMSGSTTLRAARERPVVPILCLTPMETTARRLALAWGVHTVISEDAVDFPDMVQKACAVAMAEGFGGGGAPIVITAGIPFGTPGSTNVLRIAHIGDRV